ncbi:MAG: phosphoadenosine phosphosulfate reductase family protein [Thermoproteota archaeon]
MESKQASSRDSLIHQLEARYYKEFLPLVFPQSYGERLLRNYNNDIKFWKGSNGKIVVFLSPPPKVKDDPTAKPKRLGKVIKRLAWCYQQNLSGKIRMANKVLQTLFEATDKVAVAFSGGRDSLVALHLTLQIKPDVHVMFANTSIEFPETLAYVRQLAKDWNLNFYETKPRVNFWKLAKEQGLPVAGRGNTTFMRELSKKAGVKLSNSCCRRMKETPARQFYREHGIEAVVVGLRISESLMRKLNFADYGALRYSGIYDTLVGWPLYAWTDKDIVDYIEINKLPINPLYNKGYKRTGCWACLQDMFYQDSRLFTLQRQHPHLYKTVRAQFGKEMASLLKAWAGLDGDFREEHFDGLYKPCSFEILESYRKEIQKQMKQTREK